MLPARIEFEKKIKFFNKNNFLIKIIFWYIVSYFLMKKFFSVEILYLLLFFNTMLIPSFKKAKKKPLPLI